MHIQLGTTRRDDPVQPIRGRLGAPTPRIEIRGHQLLAQPYRRFDTLRSSSPAQPYFYYTLALFGLPHCPCRRHGSLRSANSGTQYAGKQDTRCRRTRPVSPSVASSTRRRGPQLTFHKTHMAWAVTWHLPLAHPILRLVPPSPTTIRRGVSVFHAVFPSACVCVNRHDDFCPPRLSPHLSRMGWQDGCFRDCSLARAAVVLRCDRRSCCLRLICLSAGPARLVRSLPLSLCRFALLSLCSFVSHPSAWWLLLSHTSSLVQQPEGSSSAGKLQPASVDGGGVTRSLPLLTLASPSCGCS